MRAVRVGVANILREQEFQVAFVNCSDVIQEFTAATPSSTLGNSILPRTFERGADRTHSQGSNCCGDFPSIHGITIKNDDLGADPNGNASRNCWTIHELLGCFVTLKCRMRRRSWLSTLNVIVGTVKKSVAAIASR
jgi:hypothetical protein